MYNSQIYLKLQCLFIGCRPAPVAATIRMYRLKRLSIYTDLRLKSIVPFYRRFYDDGGALTNNIRSAQLLCHRIEQEDEDHLIKLTVDFPQPEQYTPFLNTEVKVDPDGAFNTRLYRKPQKSYLLSTTNIITQAELR